MHLLKRKHSAITGALLAACMLTLSAVAAAEVGSCLGPPSQASVRVLPEESNQLCTLYKAARAEGNRVVLWSGGDVPNQMDWFKEMFETRFPGITLDVLVDLSKFHDIRLDDALANGTLTTDVAMLQTTFDFDKWKAQGVLLNYKPVGFARQKPGYADPDGAWITAWNYAFMPTYAPTALAPPTRSVDFLAPGYKNKLVLTYPHDDDAVLYVYDKLQRQYGPQFLHALAAQKPEWVRGTGLPAYVIGREAKALGNLTGYDTAPGDPSTSIRPTSEPFIVWNQRAAIFRDAPHPHAARLLLSFLGSSELQSAYGGWRSRADVGEAPGVPPLESFPLVDVHDFTHWMADRQNVARLRSQMASIFGPVQGESPLRDLKLLERMGLGAEDVVAPPEPTTPPY